MINEPNTPSLSRLTVQDSGTTSAATGTRLPTKTGIPRNNSSLTGPPPFVTLDSRFNRYIFP